MTAVTVEARCPSGVGRHTDRLLSQSSCLVLESNRKMLLAPQVELRTTAPGEPLVMALPGEELRCN